MDCVYIIRDETTEEAAMKQRKKQQKEEEKLFKKVGKKDIKACCLNRFHNLYIM